MANTEEREVEAVCVFSKKLKMRASSGTLFNGTVVVFESEDPFCLIFTMDMESGAHTVRMDIYRDDLAKELREWLDGKVVRYPIVEISTRVEEAISMFVRLGQTPKQADLILWILGRTEVVFGEHPRMILGGTTVYTSSSGSRKKENMPEINASSAASSDNYDEVALRKDFPKTAAEHSRGSGAKQTVRVGRSGASNRPASADRRASTSAKTDADNNGDANPERRGSTSNIPLQTLGIKQTTNSVFMSKSHDDNLKTVSTTRQLLGKSIALDSLERHTIKGRTSSKVFQTKSWTSDHFRLVGDISRARKDIEGTMDERRKIIETARVRQQQSTEKYSKIRNKVNEAVSLNTWVAVAQHELETYQRIQSDIDVEIRKQQSRSQRVIERTRWTIAPNGFVNRRGKYEKGPYLGAGPLPAEATSKLRDMRMEETVKHYYWDSAGRRHERIDHGDSHTPVEVALEAIKKAAANIASYKLNLKEVFDHFDIDGSGKISINEMAEVFSHLGVKLDDISLQALFKHFDPNGSGFVDYGEFTWAFFNRRNLVRQWQRSLQGLTEQQIEARFRAADINGDDKLSFKEFDKMLNTFNVNISSQERQQLFARFDRDNNGFLNLEEFMKFVREEQNTLSASHSKKITDAELERRWNNSVTYKVNIAQIAAQQIKREKARAEMVKKSGGSVSPSARARTKERFYGEGNRSNSSSQQRLVRPSSADSRLGGTRPSSPPNAPRYTRPKYTRPPSPRYSFEPAIASDGYVQPPPPFNDSWLPMDRSNSPTAVDGRREIRPLSATVPNRRMTRASIIAGTSPSSSPSSSPNLNDRQKSKTLPPPAFHAKAVSNPEYASDVPEEAIDTDNRSASQVAAAAATKTTGTDKPANTSKKGVVIQGLNNSQRMLVHSSSSPEISGCEDNNGPEQQDSAGLTRKSLSSVDWATEILQKQAEIESTLGRKYYATAPV